MKGGLRWPVEGEPWSPRPDDARLAGYSVEEICN